MKGSDLGIVNSLINKKVKDTDVGNLANEIKDVQSQLETIELKKAEKIQADNIQQQVNNLVLGAVGSGNNPEVIQARGSFPLLNDRLNPMEQATNDYSNRFIDMTITNVNNLLSTTSPSTFASDVFTQNGVFNGLKGFVDGKKYVLSIRPIDSGYYTIKTIYGGTWRETYLESKFINSNEEILININNAWQTNKALCIWAGSGDTAKSFKIYLYDITNIKSELLPYINFANSTGTVKFTQIVLPDKSIKNQALGDDCVQEINIANYNIPFNKIKTRFNNKFASFLGDSLTASGSGGHYITYLNETLGFSGTKNCGIGGSRVSGSGNECFWQDYRVNSLDLTSTLINIMGGTNDAPYTTVSEGDFTLTNCDTNNFVGAYNVLISKIYYKYLKQSEGYYPTISYTGVTQPTTSIPIEIILVTPPKRFDSIDNLKKVEQFADYVKRIGKMWGLRVVDINNNMGMNDINKDLYTTSADRIHFNQNAHKLLANVWVKEII